MKKYFIFAAAAIVAMVSCSKVNPETPSVNGGEVKTFNGIELTDTPVAFQAYNYVSQTKAATANESVFYYDAFKTLGYMTNGSWASDKANAVAYMNNVEITAAEDPRTTPATTWKASSTYYWPKTGKLSFFSYYPGSITASLNSEKTALAISGYAVDNTVSGQASNISTDANGVKWDRNDVMVADPATDLTANTTPATYYTVGVPTLFRHTLAKIKFAARISSSKVAATDNEIIMGDIKFKVVINDISVKNIYKTGDYSGSAWTPDSGDGHDNAGNGIVSDDTNIAVGSELTSETAPNALNAAATYKALGTQYYVLPQSLAAAKELTPQVVVKYTVYAVNKNTDEVIAKTIYDGGEGNQAAATVALNTITANSTAIEAWAINTVYTYNFVIDVFNDEIKFDPAIEKWDTVSSDPINIPAV